MIKVPIAVKNVSWQATPSRPSTLPPTEKGATMPPTEQPDGGGKDNDSDGALGLTTTLAAAAVVAAAF